MLFYNKKEINYEKHFKINLIRILSNKQNFTNKYYLKMKLNVKAFFWFRNIKEDDLDFSKLFNHLILLWLITKQEAKITKLQSLLNKGIRYYRYIFYINIKEPFIFFNFLNEILKPISQKNTKNIHIKSQFEFLFSFRDFGSFTNMRLSSNFYLNSVHDPLYVSIKSNKSNNLNLNYYISGLKL
jgi:hypothetical protein